MAFVPKNDGRMSLESLKEMLSSEIEAEVVQLVYEQSGHNAEEALEALFRMTETNPKEKHTEESVWPQYQQEFSNKMHSDHDSNGTLPINLHAYKDVYRSNEDLYHDDTPIGMKFNLTMNADKSREPREMEPVLSDPVVRSSSQVPNQAVHINGGPNSSFSNVASTNSERAPGCYPGPLNTTQNSTRYPSSYIGQQQQQWPPSNPQMQFSRIGPRPLGDYIPAYAPYNMQPIGDSKMIQDLVLRIKSGERMMILMRGCSGSGKSTLATRLKHSGVILSTDDYFIDRKTNMYSFDPKCLTEAHQYNQHMARKAMELKRSPVIIDNTNIEAWEMKPYVAIAVKHNYSVELVEPETSWRYRVGQLFTRSVHSVPRRTIESALHRFDHNITAAQLIKSVVESNARSAVQDAMVESNEGLSILSKSTDDIVSPKEVAVAQASDNYAVASQAKPTNNATITPVINSIKMHNINSPQSTYDPLKNSALSREILSPTSSSWEMVGTVKPTISNDKSGNNYPIPHRPEAEIENPAAKLTREFYMVSLNEFSGSDTRTKLTSTDGEAMAERTVTSPPIMSNQLGQENKEPMIPSNSKQFKTTRLACAFQTPDGQNPGHASTALRIPENLSASTSTSLPIQENRTKFFLGENMEVDEMHWHPLMEGQSSSQAISVHNPIIDLTSTERDPKKPDNHEIASAFDIKRLFPTVAVNDIEDLLKNCNDDVQWAVNILLDGGYTMEPQEIPEDDFEETQKEAVEPEASKNASSAIASTSETISTLPNPRQSSKNPPKVNGLQTVDSDVVIQLDRVTALKLQELFGPVVYHLPPDSYEKDDMQVKISSEVAFAIHQCWIDTLDKKFENTNKAFQAIINDEKRAMELQYGTELGDVGPSSSQHYFEHDGTLGNNYNFQLIPTLQPEDVPERLSDIMALDAVIEENRFKGCTKTKNDIATKIKRSRLYEMFPMVDRKALEEVFEAHNYSFPNTAKAIQTTFEPEKQAQTIYTDEHLFKLNEEMLSTAIQRSLIDMSRETMQPEYDGEDIVHLALENPSYDDLRAEARLHYRLHRECLEKAQEASKRQYKAVAAHFSRMGLLHYEKVKEAHRLASKKILEMRNANNDPLKLDLHMLHVKEAVEALETFLNEKQAELMKGPKRKLEVYVITGRGIHSPGGVGKIKKAVVKFLLKNKYKYFEINPGLMQVTVVRKITS